MRGPRGLRFKISGFAVVFSFTLLLVAAADVQRADAIPVCSTLATPLPPSSTVFPGDCTGIGAGTLLATLSAPFSSASGKIAGTVVSAVYRESGGTLDFLYQITNNATCGMPPCDPISRVTSTDFSGVQTGAAIRADGGNTSPITGLGASDPFVNGTVLPQTADRNATGDTIGYNYPVSGGQIVPGSTSDVEIITTNATMFREGAVFVINGGVSQVASFAPVAAVPEPASFALLGTGLGLVLTLRRRHARA